MNKTAKNILNVLQDKPNIRAREIAKILKIDKKLVNHYLYSDLRNICIQNDNYEWRIIESKCNSKKSDVVHAKTTKTKYSTLDKNNDDVIDKKIGEVVENYTSTKTKRQGTKTNIQTLDPLKRLCNYYIDCILLEKKDDIELYAESKFKTNYVDITEWPFDSSIHSDEANAMIQKILTSNGISGYFGYPILVKNNGNVKKLSPIFLWNIDNETGKIDLSTPPILNPNIIKHYVVKNSESVVKESVKLEKELNIYDSDYVESIDELVKNLIHIRQWQWSDHFDIRNLNKDKFSQLEPEKIYNKAIILSQDGSPYTKGLITELQNLSELSIYDCKGTALYDWIMGNELDEFHNLDNNILEVLPLNNEQKKSIEKALTKNLSVITGPPGTGKSQVVINILINQVYNGHSVLFSSKNNNAVDVVTKRACELSHMPFIVRLGGKAGNLELSDSLSKILNAESSELTQTDLNQKFIKYNNCRENIDNIENQIKEYINIRNELDTLDYRLEKHRKKYNSYFSENKLFDTEKIKKEWDFFRNSHKLIFKENNSFFDRMRWNSVEKKKENTAIEAFRLISKYLNEINIFVPDEIEQIRRMDLDSLNHSMVGYLEMLNDINCYIEKYKTFSNMKSLEQLEYELIEERDNCCQLARDFWNTWLSLNHTALRPEDKRNIIEYLNGIKLLQNNQNNESIPKAVKDAFKRVEKTIPKYINAQAVTLLSASGKIPFAPGVFDMLVIDEASQCDIASALPLLFRAKKAVIIGDMNQLSHVSTLAKARDQELFRKHNLEDLSWLYSVSSLFALAQSRSSSENVIKLKEHFRSHADIIEFSNSEFYSGDLITATKYDNLILPRNENPGVRWINVDGIARKPKKKSLVNETEAAEVVKELIRLASNNYQGTIGVISPFSPQADEIKNLIAEHKVIYDSLIRNNKLEINTVHQFQGDERDIIIFSTTISEGATDSSKLFLKNNGNLFNVAITRARAILIAIGNKEYCKKCGISYMEHFVKYVDEKELNLTKSEYNISPTPEYPEVSNMNQVSDWEIYLYKKLYEVGIVTYPQYPVDKYKLDLALFDGERKLDIEVDGEMYHKTWDGELCYRDQLRNQRMFELGWSVKRFWVYQIRDDIAGCINAIRSWIDNNDIL